VRGDTVTEDVEGAHKLLKKLAKVGVDYDDVTETLELEGVQKFADSFEELLDGVQSKRDLVTAYP
jgi:transaldolase